MASNDADIDDDDDEEGLEINDDSFPELATNEDNIDCLVDEDMELPRHTVEDVTHEYVHDGAGDIDIGVPHQAVKSVPSNSFIYGIGRKTPLSPEDWLIEPPRDNDIGVPHQAVKSVPSDAIIDGIGEKSASSPIIDGIGETTASSPEDWLLEPPRVLTTYDESRSSINFSKLNLVEAWGRGNIARSERPLSSSGRKEYKFLMPMLTCMDCCFPTGRHSITVGDDRYIESISTTTNWYDGVFVSSFAQLASHYAHLTVNERFSVTDNIDVPLVIHVTFPREELEIGQYKALPEGVTRVAAIVHDADHYAVLEIFVTSKRIVVYDGLYRELLRWIDHVVCAMKRCMLIPLEADYVACADDPKVVKFGRRDQKKIRGYSLSLGSDEWRFESGDFVKQVDSFNCGPIACTKILEIFNLVTLYEVKLAYDTMSLRPLVANEWKRFLTRLNNDLVVRVRERVPLCEPVMEGGDIVVSSPNTSWLKTLPKIADAAAASSDAPIDDTQLCFCCCDSPDMELVRTECCKQLIHRKCLLAYLGINSQCCYCRHAIADIGTVMRYCTIDRSRPLPPTPAKTPSKKSPGKKRDLQQLQFEEKTPLRLADAVRSNSQEKKRRAQVNQANRMINAQGKDIEKQGGGPGAVVTVKPDYRAVSHNIGIVGVIYEMKSTGGARVATIAGMLSSGSRKGNWWIPSDQYVIHYKPHEVANITPQLDEIRQAILSGEYNKNNSARRCTIQEAHQVITQAISPCRKSKCSCAGGGCKKGRCGCITKGYKCTSACSCNGNCTSNPNNGK